VRAILVKGTVIVFSAGVIAFIIYFVLDWLTDFWGLAFRSVVDHEVYLTLIAIAMTLLLVATVGFIFSRENLLSGRARFLGKIPLLNWFTGEKQMPQTVQDMPGALVRFSEGSYYIAAIVGGQKFQNKDGEIEMMYKLYCPSAPVPWSGLPLIFAKQEHVILLRLSFAEIYGITTSFGRASPEVLEELELVAGPEEELPSPDD
jgi:uncharacterized membrane protein